MESQRAHAARLLFGYVPALVGRYGLGRLSAELAPMVRILCPQQFALTWRARTRNSGSSGNLKLNAQLAP